jgi:hypothetical protein
MGDILGHLECKSRKPFFTKMKNTFSILIRIGKIRIA